MVLKRVEGREKTSAKNISVQAEWLRQSGRAPSERSETPRRTMTPRQVSIQHVTLHIALRSPFRHFFSLCRSPIFNKHSGAVANCDHPSEWVHWVHICIGIAIGDAGKISPCVPSTWSSRSEGRWEDMILPGREDPRNLGQSEWDQKLGKIECEFSLNDKRRWKWDDVYLLRGLPNIYSPSLCSPPLPLYLRTTAVAPWRWTWSSMFGMHLETEIEWTQRCTWRPGSSEFGDALGDREIEWTQRCTWRPWLSEFGDALGDCDRVNSEMDLEARIERVWRCTWRPWSCELAGRNRATLELHLEAVSKRVWRYTWRPWSSEFGDALAGYDRARLEEYLEAADLEGGAKAAETLFIG